MKRIMLMLATCLTGMAQANDYDPSPAWPLCGRIAEAPPVGWDASQGCPSERWGSAAHADFPIASTFGPRQLPSDNYRYDFHRGLDIGTATGTPIFAITDGVVRIAGEHASYSDPLIQLRHFRPGAGSSCTAGNGCYHSNYMHLSGWVVAAGDHVSKGQLLGYTGVSGSGFAHLHFEIRDAPADDPFSAWQRDAIQPLNLLPYDSQSAPDRQIRIQSVDVSNPFNPIVSLEVEQPSSDPRLDLARVEIQVLQKKRKSYVAVDQPGSAANADGYHVSPPWVDFDQRNHEYTHKDSSSVPWESFANCPYAADHGPGYDANVHLDRAHPTDPQVGDFNGVELAPAHYNASSESYLLGLRFTQLVGIADASKLCLRAIATSAHGQTIEAEWNCGTSSGGGGGGKGGGKGGKSK